MPQPASNLQLPPLSLYIHVPWCVRKCPYCDFNSHKAEETLPEQAYIAALVQDLKADMQYVQGRKIHSIFIGGGTPSLLSVAAYQELFAQLQQHVIFTDDIEITLEANPGTFEAEKFKGYRQLGINRLSIGVQSFADQQLKTLGRIHNSEQAIKAISMAKDAGFDNFNIDLMHGLPEQTIEQALADIQQAIDLSPTHISWYQLTIEANTEFHKYPPALPADETLWDIQEAGQTLLAQHGFNQYEISAYSQKNKQAKHNINYWSFGDYLGIGAGAHGKVTLLDQNKILRLWKTRAPKDYLAKAANMITGNAFTAGQDAIEKDDLALEFIMNALRLYQGFDLTLMQARTGLQLADIEAQLNNGINKGLLSFDRDLQQVNTTEKGRLFLNDVLELFM